MFLNVTYMRRKHQSLQPVEQAILYAALDLQDQGSYVFHGFQLLKIIKDQALPPFTSTSALYKALRRLEESGFIASEWEDPEAAAVEARPRRRIYHLLITESTIEKLLSSQALRSPRLASPALAATR